MESELIHSSLFISQNSRGRGVKGEEEGGGGRGGGGERERGN
jgi:hypothetical protein